jgi:hypothetical protein
MKNKVIGNNYSAMQCQLLHHSVFARCVARGIRDLIGGLAIVGEAVVQGALRRAGRNCCGNGMCGLFFLAASATYTDGTS